MHPILIDTDAGEDIDDVLAIAFAARRPELQLLGVTTVMHDVRRRAQLVRRVLDLCEKPDVPVGIGAQFPLKTLDDDARLRITNESKVNHCPPLATGYGDHEDAIALMARQIEQHPGRVTLVGIGPSTNIAMLLCRRPDLTGSIKAIALMGGELALRQPEHNILADDVAAQQVLTCGVPLFLGTWSVTRQVVMLPPDCQQLRHRNTPLGNFLWDCYQKWQPVQSWKPGPVMYDLAPILWRFRPDLFQTQPMRVQVETTAAHTRGWTVAVPGPSNADVTVAMNAEESKRLLMETLLG